MAAARRIHPAHAGGLVAISTGPDPTLARGTNEPDSASKPRRVYLGGVAVGSAGAFYLAVDDRAEVFRVWRAGLFWVEYGLDSDDGDEPMPPSAARNRDGTGEWMIRSYTVTFCVRVVPAGRSLLIHWRVAPADQIDAMTAWACWSCRSSWSNHCCSYRRRAGEHPLSDRIDLFAAAAQCLSQPTLPFGAPYIAESKDDASPG